MRPAEAYKKKKQQGVLGGASGDVLSTALEHATLARVAFRWDDALDGRTWKAVLVGGEEVFAAGVAPSAGDESVYVSIRQQRDGRHEFVALADVLAGANPLPLLDEAEVKLRRGPRLYYARAAVAAPPPTGGAGAGLTRWDHADLTPHGSWTNYSVVPWLSLGRTQALLLSDEETLCRDIPTEGIFAHLRLVINCHADSPARQYVAGSPWDGAGPPKCVAHAVHKWYSSRGSTEINKKIDGIKRVSPRPRAYSP